MALPRIYIYTNIPSPYNYHYWNAVCREFSGSAIIFTQPMHKDRVWTDELATQTFKHYYFYQNLNIPKMDMVSTGLIPWLFSHAHGGIHVLSGACGRVNSHIVRFLVKRLGGKLVLRNDGAFADKLSKRAVARHRKLWRGTVSAVYTPGEIGRNYYRKLGYKDEQIFNAYFSHDVDWFASEREQHGVGYRDMIRGILGIPRDHFVVLNISRFLDWKRLEDLHESLMLLERRGIRNVHLILIGYGSHTAPVSAMQKELKVVRFHWVKGVPYNDMPKYYAASDVMVFPSEGDIWGLVVNEALSMGKPVICTERIGASEMVENGVNGFVVPIREPSKIADRILRLYEDRNLLNKMSVNAVDIQIKWNHHLAINSLKRLVEYISEHS